MRDGTAEGGVIIKDIKRIFQRVGRKLMKTRKSIGPRTLP